MNFFCAFPFICLLSISACNGSSGKGKGKNDEGQGAGLEFILPPDLMNMDMGPFTEKPVDFVNKSQNQITISKISFSNTGDIAFTFDKESKTGCYEGLIMEPNGRCVLLFNVKPAKSGWQEIDAQLNVTYKLPKGSERTAAAKLSGAIIWRAEVAGEPKRDFKVMVVKKVPGADVKGSAASTWSFELFNNTVSKVIKFNNRDFFTFSRDGNTSGKILEYASACGSQLDVGKSCIVALNIRDNVGNIVIRWGYTLDGDKQEIVSIDTKSNP
jgi:hypothetical protein